MGRCLDAKHCYNLVVITVNGTMQEFNEPTFISDLIKELNLQRKLCAVEVNKNVVPHQCRETFQLQDGDAIEIVSLVGGG